MRRPIDSVRRRLSLVRLMTIVYRSGSSCTKVCHTRCLLHAFLVTNERFSGPNQWLPSSSPPSLDAFRSNLELLFARYHALNLTLNQHIAHLLSIPYSILESYYPEERTEFNSAIWHYFPVTEEIRRSADPREDQPFVPGMHAHRDPSTFLTCLIQSRKGLEVLNRRGRWVEVPMVEGGVVCNIGVS